MKNNILICLFIVGFGLSGCTTKGFGTAGHNGKLYYFPVNCGDYSYSYTNPDELYCINNGVNTGQRLKPADNQQIQSFRYQQQKNKNDWNELNKAIKSMTPKRTNTNCYSFDSYSIDCTSTTY